MNLRLAYAAVLLASFAAACGGGPIAGADAHPRPDTATGTDAPRVDGTAGTDGGTDRGVPGPLSWAGVYDANGLWDLSGPITAQRTLGDVVADLLIDEIVSRSGVPSALQSQAQSVVRTLVGGTIKTLVDAAAPDALKPGSPLLMRLATVLASTEVTSTIDIFAGTPADSLRGTEELRTFKFGFQGRTGTLPAGDLLDQTAPPVTLGADWRGTQAATGTNVSDIAPHEFALRLGKMILWVVDNVLQEAGASSLSQAAASAINCAAITSAITNGQGSFSFGIGSLSYAVSASSLTAGCTAATGVVRDKALGLFDVDAGVALGGPVEAIDDDGNAVADRLKSLPGYGGMVTKGRAAIAPRVAARFEAIRRASP